MCSESGADVDLFRCEKAMERADRNGTPPYNSPVAKVPPEGLPADVPLINHGPA